MSAFDPVFNAIAAEQSGQRCFVVLNDDERHDLIKRSEAVVVDFAKTACTTLKTFILVTMGTMASFQLAETNMGRQWEAFWTAPDSPNKLKIAFATSATMGVLLGGIHGIKRWNDLWEERRVAAFLFAQDVRPVAACVGLEALSKKDLAARPLVAFMPERPWNDPHNSHDIFAKTTIRLRT